MRRNYKLYSLQLYFFIVPFVLGISGRAETVASPTTPNIENLHLLPADINSAKFKDLIPGISFRMGSLPFRLEVKGEKKLLNTLSFRVRPGNRLNFLETVKLKNGCFKCIPNDEPKKNKQGLMEVPQIKKDNSKLATFKIKLNTANYDKTSQTLMVDIPELPIHGNKTKNLYVTFYKREKLIYSEELTLEQPFLTQIPLLNEIAKQLKLGENSIIFPKLPPKVVYVDTDCCGESELVTLDFAEDLKIIGVLNGKTMVTTKNWIMVADSNKFSFDKVIMSNVTYLGDRYQCELLSERTIKTKNSITAVFEIGDFSDCLGAGCGEAVNVREARVTLKNGILSTEFTR